MRIKGILHVGAFDGAEASVYDDLGIDNVTWIEGNPTLIPFLESRVAGYGHRVIGEVVSDREGLVDFKITNNGESSSILELGTHKETSPQVHVVETVELMAYSLNYICQAYSIDDFNFLNLDLQGAELLALRGLGPYLDLVDYIYTEVNRREVYIGCAQVEELDEFLSDFVRVHTYWCEDGNRNHGWGDACYVRKS